MGISLLEGCQISIVGLQDIDLELYKHSHPRAYKALKLCFQGPNVERFLVGRQFLLLFNGFLVSKVAGAGTPNFYIGDWHWSEEASQFFWANSVLLMILLAAFAQLVTQLLAAQKMLGFINLPFHAYYTIVLPCLAIDLSASPTLATCSRTSSSALLESTSQLLTQPSKCRRTSCTTLDACSL